MMRQTIQAVLRPPLTELLIRFFFLFAVVFFVLPRKAYSSIDRYFEACSVPKSCGDGQNISFPFYIVNQQEPFCGFPGFELTCDNRSGKPLLRLRDNNDYIVHHISYGDQTLRVSNAAVSGKESVGSPSVCGNGSERPKNLSLPEERFQLVSNRTKIFLFYNCNLTGVPRTVLPYKIGDCGDGADEEAKNSTLAIYDNDAYIPGLAAARCGRAVEVPVEHERRGGEGEGFKDSIEEELRDGFWLKWIASNCSVCEQSGGKCGFDRSIYHFRCFCPDRPHAWWCAPRTPTGTCVLLPPYIRFSAQSNVVACYD